LRFFGFLGYNGKHMDILYGKPVADGILSRLKEKISQKGSAPKLAVVLVGDNKASGIYVNLKEKKAREIGVGFFLSRFPADVEENYILAEIRRLNDDVRINGIIVQLPLPEKLDASRIINEISVEKDVDGFSTKEGRPSNLTPVFPKAIMMMIGSSGKEIFGKKALVVANSDRFGEAMCSVLEKSGTIAGYILADTVSDNIEKIRDADIVVTAVGECGIISGSMIRPSAIVIDGGMVEKEGHVSGDVDFLSVSGMAGYVSPVPGGVGPVTIACLLENVYLAYENQNITNTTI